MSPKRASDPCDRRYWNRRFGREPQNRPRRPATIMGPRDPHDLTNPALPTWAPRAPTAAGSPTHPSVREVPGRQQHIGPEIGGHQPRQHQLEVRVSIRSAFMQWRSLTRQVPFRDAYEGWVFAKDHLPLLLGNGVSEWAVRTEARGLTALAVVPPRARRLTRGAQMRNFSAAPPAAVR